MKALKYHAPWDLSLADVEGLRAVDPDDVVVDVRFCGICGTDLGIVSGGYPVAVPGVTLGHEASGVVSAVGPNVTDIKVGDRVVVNPTPYCGSCRMCRTQRINHCVDKARTESGVNYDGAYAGQYRTTSGFVHVLPDHVSLEAAALTEPLSCVLSGVRKIQPPTMAAYTYVFGAGPLGMLYAWALWLRGLTPVVIEKSAARLAYASGRLPDGVRAYSALAEARSRAFGDADAPLDIVVDTTSALLEELYPRLACGGTFLSVGLKERAFTIDGMHLADRSLSVIGSIDSLQGSFMEAFHLVTTGRIPVERLISHVVPLSSFREGFAVLGCDIEARSMTPADTRSCKVLLAVGETAARQEEHA